MGAALVAGAAGVFALASSSIKSSQANTEISSNLRVVCSWLQRDFNRMRLDGPLVIQPEEYYIADGRTPRADLVFFVISGDIPSLTVPDFHAALAMVTYGQDDYVAYGQDGPADNDPGEFTTFLTRRAGLMVANPPSSGSEIYAWSFAGLLDYWNNNPWPWASWGRPDLDDPNLRYTRMLGRVQSFRAIRYYMSGADEPDDVNLGAGPILFEPNQPKPVWIDFEIIFRDSNKVVREGYTATYRVHLPTE